MKITTPNQIKLKLIDAGLDKHGWRRRLARVLGINYNALSMAMTGHRKGPASQKILNRLGAYLDQTLDLNR